MDDVQDIRLFIEGSRHLLILCHSNADPDAVASAYALVRAFPCVTISVRSDGISRPAKTMLGALGATLPCDDGPYDAVLAVDTATPEQLGACKDLLPPRDRLCCVDHHAVSILDAGVSCRRGATSAAEIVWDIIGRHAEVPVRKALLYGILSDTGHLRYATRDTFAVIQELLGDDIVFEEIYSLLREEIDLSQKMALFKAMQRMKVLRAGDFLVVRTAIGSFESLVARTILSAGADVVVIVNEKRGGRIIARASRRAVEKGVDLSRIMYDVGLEYDGEGGGHAPAAGAKGVNDFKKAATQIIDTITALLSG